jgi:hypothetical protein
MNWVYISKLGASKPEVTHTIGSSLLIYVLLGAACRA